jgi:Helix-turn-helix domain of resolvase
MPLLKAPEIMRSAAAQSARSAAHSSAWLCIIARSALSAYCNSPQYAEFEREILRERTRAGLAHARQNGKRLGRPATAAVQAAEIRELHHAGISKSEIARRLQIGRTSVRRILEARS